ncbi:MAG: glycosyl hydrolase family protein, partial [Sphingobacteriales bacterium]
MNYNKNDFGDDFIWGISTAAYQIEGGHNSDGKGPSIWDAFVKGRSRIPGKQYADVACDFYNLFDNDLDIIRDLHIPNHRFSISWSRIIPGGKGAVNQRGIDFYNRVIDQSLAKGIQPWVTLYHWDLPLALQLEGGWTNRDIVDWFAEYVAQCSKYFGDRVKNWIILNEPMVFTGAGYFLGVHAPGKKGLKNFLSAVHHAALCQAEGGRVLRELRPQANIGTTFSCSHVAPLRATRRDIEAAKKADILLNRLFIEPLLGLGYPIKELRLLERVEAFIKPGDEEKLAFDMDFIGVQNYTREVVTYNAFTPFIQARILKASKRKVPRTEMDWEVY